MGSSKLKLGLKLSARDGPLERLRLRFPAALRHSNLYVLYPCVGLRMLLFTRWALLEQTPHSSSSRARSRALSTSSSRATSASRANAHTSRPSSPAARARNGGSRTWKSGTTRPQSPPSGVSHSSWAGPSEAWSHDVSNFAKGS